MNVLAALPEETTSSAAIAVLAVFGLIVIVSVVALFAKAGRRLLLPVIAVLLGASTVATTVWEAVTNRPSPITFIGLVIGILLLTGGLGALREGVILPDVEGTEPEVAPQPPRITPDDRG